MEAGVGGGRLGGACDNEISDGMHCMNHPHRNNNPGGICAFCLQDKLRNLLSSSFPTSPPLSSASSPSPPPSSSSSVKTNHDHNTRSRLPFLVPKINNNKKPSSYPNTSSSANIIFKRSESTATPKRNQFLEEEEGKDFSPRKRKGFWSFLYPSSSKEAKSFSPNGKYRGKCLGKKIDHVITMEDDKCLSSSSSKVSRSRSVGCGSRSFSGDFFERISSGLGDCTLRRVESQREGGKPKLPASANTMNHCMKERVRCGGIFSGFVMTSSSSTTFWVSSSVDDGRGRSWGWAFASPMRAFTTKGSSSSSSKRDASDKNNATPNLSAIPTLLTVRG